MSREKLTRVFCITLIVIHFVVCLIDFTTWSQGINTYPMYFILGLVLLYLMIHSSDKNEVYYSVIFVGATYVLTEVFNYFYFSFYPATSYFEWYSFFFTSLVIISLIKLVKGKVRWDLNRSKFIRVSFAVILAVAIGYFNQFRI